MGNKNDLALFGVDLFGNVAQQDHKQARAALAQRFVWPPFTVLDAKSGAWQQRKEAWLALGIKSELGRHEYSDGRLNYLKDNSPTTQDTSTYRKRGAVGKGIASYSPMTQDIGHYKRQKRGNASRSVGSLNSINSERYGRSSQPTTSVFDPVLCELMYTWFCPAGGQIVDPFAGGSVRGVVAALLGYAYWGCDLSANQIEANREQGALLTPNNPPQWVNGDSAIALSAAPEADFIFSCPPYGDLEIYSDDPADISTMSYDGFMEVYSRIVALCAERLKPNRYACFVVGEFRDKATGNYRGFVPDTIGAFKAAGLALYNEAILLTAIGSLPVRVSNQFEKSRKLGKTHQNVLVFAKGDGRLAFHSLPGKAGPAAAQGRGQRGVKRGVSQPKAAKRANQPTAPKSPARKRYKARGRIK